jgi:hypothetical protein
MLPSVSAKHHGHERSRHRCHAQRIGAPSARACGRSRDRIQGMLNSCRFHLLIARP